MTLSSIRIPSFFLATSVCSSVSASNSVGSLGSRSVSGFLDQCGLSTNWHHLMDWMWSVNYADNHRRRRTTNIDHYKMQENAQEKNAENDNSDECEAQSRSAIKNLKKQHNCIKCLNRRGVGNSQSSNFRVKRKILDQVSQMYFTYSTSGT